MGDRTYVGGPEEGGGRRDGRGGRGEARRGRDLGLLACEPKNPERESVAVLSGTGGGVSTRVLGSCLF